MWVTTGARRSGMTTTVRPLSSLKSVTPTPAMGDALETPGVRLGKEAGESVITASSFVETGFCFARETVI
jgi:hypothetical protein